MLTSFRNYCLNLQAYSVQKEKCSIGDRHVQSAGGCLLVIPSFLLLCGCKWYLIMNEPKMLALPSFLGLQMNTSIISFLLNNVVPFLAWKILFKTMKRRLTNLLDCSLYSLKSHRFDQYFFYVSKHFNHSHWS